MNSQNIDNKNIDTKNDDSNNNQCKATTKKGHRCKRNKKVGEILLPTSQPIAKGI